MVLPQTKYILIGMQYLKFHMQRLSVNRFVESWELGELGENNGKTHPCFCTFRRGMTCV